jgi:predicted CoA-substrate-specific enzyme activase
MRILGIDLGSREVKLVLLVNGEITRKYKISTMKFYRDYCKQGNCLAVDLDKLDIGNIDAAVSTGYGRNNYELAEFKPINELKAHVYGVFYQLKLKNFILLDIGGQDVKVVKVEKGIITDMELNDKCAASSGRYIENMASLLEIPIEELTSRWENPLLLNSTCSVFSESELIGKISEGVPIERLAASVNYSLYCRLEPLLSKLPGQRIVVTGGVALNQAIIHYLQADYDEVLTVSDPQYNGAIGCCYYGKKFLDKGVI